MQDSFLPTDLTGWLGLLIQSLTIATLVGGVIWRLFLNQLNGLGKRLDAVTTSCTANGTKTDLLHHQQERYDFQAAANSERMGRIESAVKEAVGKVDQFRDRALEEEVGIKERLAGIESNMNIFKDIRDILIQIAKERRP